MRATIIRKNLFVCLVAYYRTRQVQPGSGAQTTALTGQLVADNSIPPFEVLGLHSGSATSLARNSGNEVNIRGIGPLSAFLSVNWLLPLEDPTICSSPAAGIPPLNFITPQPDIRGHNEVNRTTNTLR